MTYVLDTNTVIYYFKGVGQVGSYLADTPPNQLAIPTVVLFELYVGIAKSTNPERRHQQLNRLVSQVTLLPFTKETAAVAANIRAHLETQGQPIGPMDCLIAGTSLACNGTLVTHNTREFSRVEGLSLVDWY